MADAKPLIRELAEYALSKKNASQDGSWSMEDALEFPHLHLATNPYRPFFDPTRRGGFWTEFFEVEEKDGQYAARFPVQAEQLKGYQQKYPGIQKASWSERDGHVYMTIPLDGSIPATFIKSVIDEAYAIVWKKLDAEDRSYVELANLPYDERKLIDRLVEVYELTERRTEIQNFPLPAILLRTRKSMELDIPLGASKIGGRPDLPPNVKWPVYSNCKPLAFLAQIDLAEIDRLGNPMEGLPSNGLLSLFSVWGWMDPDDADPHTPNDGTLDCQEESGWSCVIHTAAGAKLERRETPEGVNEFIAAAVEPTPCLCLPRNSSEPPLNALSFSDEEMNRYDRLESCYRSLQMGHRLNNYGCFASHHLLGGFAQFQQEYPEELSGTGLAMFMQIGTDGNNEMMWSDGGELVFYADEEAMSEGRFERIWGTCQGG